LKSRARSRREAPNLTRPSRPATADVEPAADIDDRSSNALLLARGAQARFAAAWGLGETGPTGPTGNRYGDPAATLVSPSTAWSRAMPAVRREAEEEEPSGRTRETQNTILSQLGQNAF
jgi:hypothetical protein